MIINYSIQWYAVIQLLAIFSFILTFKTFSNLKDHGYTISKSIGLIVASLLSWTIMSYNGGLFKFTPMITYISSGILAITCLILLFKVYSKDDRKTIFHFMDKRYKLIIITEAVFIGILILSAYLRGFNPDILGVNKLQEYVYINSILSSNSLPAENLWFSGYKINLYYSGYFIVAFLVNLSKIPLEYAFNLVPGTIIGLISITSGGIVYNLTERKFYAFLGAILTGFGSNYIALKNLISKGLENGMEWWDSAHFLPNNIFAEFPFWSLVLGDIEPFFISSFIILTLLYLIHSLSKKESPFIFNEHSIDKTILWILIITTSAILITTNLFALPFIVIAIVIGSSKPIFKDYKNKKHIKNYIITIITCTTAIILLDMPFILSYIIPYKSLGFVGKEETISLINLILMSGAFLLPIIILIIVKLKEILKTNWKTIILIGISILSTLEIILIYKSNLYPGWLWIIISIPLIVIAVLSIQTAIINNGNLKFKKNLGILLALFVILTIEILITNNPVTLFSIILVIFSFYILVKSDNNISWTNGTILFTVALILLLSDTLYLKIENNTNSITTSYLLTQVILLLPITSTISIFIIFEKLKQFNKDILTAILTIIFIPCFIFTILAPYYRTNKYNIIENLTPNLSGINHLEVFHYPDYEAIEWIKENIPKNSIILEGIKPEEVYHGRISGYSGRKTLLAWPSNKFFTYGAEISKELDKRLNDINKIFMEKDKTKIKNLIKEYKIDYIYIGELEKKIYPEDSLSTFKDIATLEFQSSSDKSYKLYKLKGNPID